MKPLPILKKIKSSFDYQSFLESSGLSMRYAPNGEYRICCVSCMESKYKLYVNDDKKAFLCFKCGFGNRKHDVFDLVALVEGITRGQAILRMVRDFQDTTPEDTQAAYEALGAPVAPTRSAGIKTIPGLPLGCQLLTEPVSDSNRPFWEYLLQRGLTVQEVLACQTCYVPDTSLQVLDSRGKSRGDIGRRIVWPVYGGSHKMVSWLSRVIISPYTRGDKYLNCPESELAKTFWPYAKPYDGKVVLVEGLLDCLAVRRIGKISAYATLGKHISIEQISLLNEWGVREVTIFWDKRDAKKEIMRAVEELKTFFPRVNVLWQRDWPIGEDAGDCLAKLNGTDMIKEALAQKVDTTSLDYTKWLIMF